MDYLRKILLRSAVFSVCLCATVSAAEPFHDCPTEAFLVQSGVAKLYGVQLATGHYQLLSSDMGTSSKLNAIAFNFHDNYLYAWSKEFGTLVKIGTDYQASALETSNNPDATFYVGDISLEDNIYYAYRPGSSYGLYAYNLDESEEDYLRAVKIVSGDDLSLNIFDFAFHPLNHYAYSVDRNGVLHRIDVELGIDTALNNVGESGTFGAVYFDVDGHLYISRNSDGYIFRVDVNDATPLAEFYAYGPSSSNNDGARCAMAPIVDVEISNIDFGDAPDSYFSSLENNGARHGLFSSTLYLGEGVDSESDSFIHPLSDDETGIDDDDGVGFVSGIEVGEDSIVEVSAVGSGFLNAWIDWDQNGVFDTDEKIISGQSLREGNNVITYSVPISAKVGDTWSRFRYSSTELIEASGGVSDGEVEDYFVTVTETGVSTVFYPSENSWSTLAFEDNWPSIGDYDFNDLVIHYRTAISSKNGAVRRIRVQGQVAAVGASYHNGFAIHLPGILRSQIDESRIQFTVNRADQAESPLESGPSEAILIAFLDAWDYVTPGEDCKYHRTESGCGSSIQMDFSITVPFVNAIPLAQMPTTPFDPFMFATPGKPHNPALGNNPGRSLEIHLKNHAPTSAFNLDYLGRRDDRSNGIQEKYFLSENGMPWAIHVANKWRYPKEYMDVIYAYPHFQSFISSAGGQDGDWYLDGRAQLQNTFSQ